MAASRFRTFPYARTNDEAYLYMNMRPCVCGVDELADRSIATGTADGVVWKQFSGRCAGCGRERQFTFEMPEISEARFEVRYGPHDEPSHIIDAGEWLAAAEMFSTAAQERLDGGEPRDDDEVTRTYYLLTSALAAVEEAMKFLPQAGDAIPEGAFWTPAGRMFFEAAPDLFTRHRLAEQQSELRKRVDHFEERHADADDDPED
jgi:hypothetical protein